MNKTMQIRNLAAFLPMAIFVLWASSRIMAQAKGSISGRIIDKSTNEPLIGANVVVIGTGHGASSDLDGRFSIKPVEPGTYSLRFTYVSYTQATVNNVVVEAGRDTRINIALVPSAIELNPVIVSTDAIKTSEFSVLSIQKNANSIIDGVSAELISKYNSSDGTDVLKRMTGVTVSEGRYAYIRGVGDRYNSTMLNGSSLPSTDPEKRSFSYDMVPASLIENMLTIKTATPDRPADFSGGLIDIRTIEFPPQLIASLSLSSSYDSQTNFQDFVRYRGGNTDWLGMDDGTRSLPSTVNASKVDRGNYTSDELRTIGTSFKNNWNPTGTKAPLNGNFKLNLGNSFDLGTSMLGFIGSLSYSNTNEITQLEDNYYTFDGPRYEYKGFNYANVVSWNAMVNATLKLGILHKFSLKNMVNRNAENETTILEGPSYYFPDYRKTTSFRFVSRSLYSSQLIGEHHFKIFHGLGLDWNLNYGTSERDEPDARRYIYSRDLDQPESPLRFLLDPSLANRFFGSLNDTNLGASTDLSIKLFQNPAMPNVKLGFYSNKKNRDFSARTFGFWNVPGGDFIAEDQLMTQPVETILSPEHFENRFIEVLEITKPSDSYASAENVSSAYLMTHFNVWTRLKVIMGVRFEKSRQTMDSHTITNESVLVNSVTNDWLPSLNATLAVSKKMIARVAFSRTLARPEFRELAPFSYFDFLTYELVEGNPGLKRCLISNYDVRFEFYPTNLELAAISGFYKKLNDPIEEVLLAASAFQPIRSFENAKQAVNYGAEIEVKKKLGFVARFLDPLSVVGNLSFIHSEITLQKEDGFQAGKRPLQGQANYIVNFGFYYEGWTERLSASLIYNRVGEKINRVGFANLGNFIETPRDQIDLSLSVKPVKAMTIKVLAKDLLNQDHKIVQESPEGDKTAKLRKTGRILSIGCTFQL